MTLDESHPMNRLVLTQLRDAKRLRFNPAPIMAPGKHPNPYVEAGSHPDVVERVWDALGRALPVDGRAVIYGAPALVHPDAGIILALAYGTQYALRVPETLFATAIQHGCKVEHTWSNGTKTSIADLFGPGWVFGAWRDEESQWLASAYKGIDTA